MNIVRPPLIELRQYVLAPGRRERMVELFDTHFAEAQDALGLPILGQFRPVGNPDGLVWIRGFPDMASRPDLLGRFYGGDVWSEWGPEAIGYVVGFNNVQLLRVAAPEAGVTVDLDARPALGNTAARGVVVATSYRLAQAPEEMLLQLCNEAARADGGRLLGFYVSDATPNNFPTLPIREREHLFTWFAAYNEYKAIPTPDVAVALSRHFVAPPERLILEPTSRSLLP